MVFCIEKFSSSFCLAYVTFLTPDDLPPTCFVMADDFEAVLGVMYKLGDMFEKELDSIAEKIKDVSEFDFELFMKAFLSRCVIISETPCYLSFMLLCPLIVTIASPIFLQHKCFTYAMICCLCLRIVYERCYKNLFDEMEAYESLDSYCRRIIPSPGEEEGKLLLSVHDQRQISLLLSKAVDIDYTNFILTDSEMEILHKTIDIIMVEDFLPNPYESTDVRCESDSFSNVTMDVDDEVDCVCSNDEVDCVCSNVEVDCVCSKKHEECSSEENEICNFCFGKCFRYRMLYKGEIQQQELAYFSNRSSCNG